MSAPSPPVVLEREVAARRWYHTLELPGGIVTPGEYDLRPIVGRLPIPESLEGKRCLDVGGRDGFYSFEMERRGAREVVSVDISDPELVDFPVSRPPRGLIQEELDAGNSAFELAREALDSEVQRVHVSAYALSADELGSFDFAVIGTLLLHLRDPVAALASIGGVLSGQLLVNEAVVPTLDSLRRAPRAELLMRDGPFWWLANPSGLARMAEAAGLELVARGRPYLLPHGSGSEVDRASASALGRPVREIPRRVLYARGLLHAWVLVRPARGKAG